MPEVTDSANIKIINEGVSNMDYGFRKDRGNINISGMTESELMKALDYKGYYIGYYEDREIKDVFTFGLFDDTTAKIEKLKEAIQQYNVRLENMKIKRAEYMEKFKLKEVEAATGLIENLELDIKRSQQEIDRLLTVMPEVHAKKIDDLEALIAKAQTGIIEPAKAMIAGLKKVGK